MEDLEMNDVLEQVKAEYTASFNATQPKRNLFRERLTLYNNINRTDDKININLIRSLINQLLALYFTDEMQVKFIWRQPYTDVEADMLNAVAKFDFDEMNIGMLDYQNQRNRFFYWVWVRAFTWRDKEAIFPQFKVIDPISCYPDPDWHTHINNFKFYSIDLNTTLSELIEQVPEIINVEALKNNLLEELENAQLSQNEQITDVRKKRTRYINPWFLSKIHNHQFTVNYHYTTIHWEPYLILNYAQKTVLLIKKIEVTKWKQIKFPIALNYREPITNDPRWLSVPDLVEDKQKNIQLFYNLMNIKAKRQALWREMFLDRSIVEKNKWELLQPTIWPKYIPVDSWDKAINQLVYSLPDDPISPDVFQMPNLLLSQAQSDTSISSQTWWVANSNVGTAKEAEILQQNANVNLALWVKVNSRWEKTFWKIRYLFYDRYFGEYQEKYVRLNKSLWPVWVNLKRHDFITGTDPDIAIISKVQYDQENQRQSVMFGAVMWTLLGNPNISTISKNFIMRKSLKLAWQSREEIELMVPPTPEEMNAQEQVISMLNYNIVPEITDLDEDHLTYISIYQTAKDTPAKVTAINMRQQAYIDSWQAKQQSMLAIQWSWNNAQANMSSNMLMNNMIQQKWSQVPSTKDIAQQ